MTRMPGEQQTEEVAGFRVCNMALKDCLQDMIRSLRETQAPLFFACANPHSIVVAHSNALFTRALKAADWLTPDGVGVVIASRLLGGKIRERITGSAVFFGLSKGLDDSGGHRCFFLGSSEETLAKIAQRFDNDYPSSELVGTYSPPFKSEFSESDVDAMIAAVNDAKPDVLWVGMTAPKQEIWIHNSLSRLDVSFVGAIGAVFDFYAGTVERPSRLFRGAGLEWLGRLLREPGRLWRRTIVSGPRFLLLALFKRGADVHGKPAGE